MGDSDVEAVAAGYRSADRGTFGEAWIEAFAAAHQVEPYTGRSDKRKTDALFLHENGEVARIQVKTTESPGRTRAGLTYAIDIATYDALRQGSTKGILALVVLHDAAPRWVDVTQQGSLVMATGYALDLSSAPEKPGQASVTLTFEPGMMLTRVRLHALFGAVVA